MQKPDNVMRDNLAISFNSGTRKLPHAKIRVSVQGPHVRSRGQGLSLPDPRMMSCPDQAVPRSPNPFVIDD